jgi:hypothetical protein
VVAPAFNRRRQTEGRVAGRQRVPAAVNGAADAVITRVSEVIHAESDTTVLAEAHRRNDVANLCALKAVHRNLLHVRVRSIHHSSSTNDEPSETVRHPSNPPRERG